MKSYVEPQLGKQEYVETSVNWLPLDAMTAEELAQTNLLKAQTDVALMQAGALSSEDIRQRVATDKESGYNEIGILEDIEPEAEEIAEEDLIKTPD